MPKLKTHKATVKRFHFTGNKKESKILRRAAGQDHFNARESGSVTMSKRRDISVDQTNYKIINKLTPYS